MPGHVLTVTLNPAIDKTVRGKKSSLSAGGKGINVSRALNILGIKNTATGIIGGKSGDKIVSLLKKEKINNDFFRIKGRTRTNLTVIGLRGRISRSIQKGPKVNAAEFEGFKKKFNSLLKGCKFVIFSGANANGLTGAAYAQLIGIAAKKNIGTALDTRDLPLKKGLAARPIAVKPNLKEAEYLAGRKLGSLSAVKDAARLIRKRGAKIVVITLGAGGAVAFDGKETAYATAPKAKAANSVGCGDAFLAGFIACHLENRGLGECLRAAAAIGAASAKSLKPGYFKWK